MGLAALSATARPSETGQHQTLTKLAEAANCRRAEGAAGKGVMARAYGVGGNALRHLHRGVQEAGIYQTSWDGRDKRGRTEGSGVYFCRLRAGEQVRRRMRYLR